MGRWRLQARRWGGGGRGGGCTIECGAVEGRVREEGGEVGGCRGERRSGADARGARSSGGRTAGGEGDI